MIAIKPLFGILAAASSFINLSFYLRSMYLGRTKPHAFSWLLWCFITMVVYIAQIFHDAGAGAWQTIVSALMCGAIGLYALKRGTADITRGDRWALAGCLAAIPLWLVTRDALAAVTLLTCIDIAGFYPTFRKSYNHPHEENLIWPFRGVVTFVLSTVALENYEIINIIYPVGMMVVHLLLGLYLLWRRKAVRLA